MVLGFDVLSSRAFLSGLQCNAADNMLLCLPSRRLPSPKTSSTFFLSMATLCVIFLSSV